MKKSESIKNRYFKWMCTFVSDCDKARSYQKLFRFLNGVEFFYTIEMDGNREADGIDLRYRFGYENGYDPLTISSKLNDCPCSVLEMMIALSIRCEEHIMDDPDIGNRTAQWFWEMIENLGLLPMTDLHFDEELVGEAIDRFLHRDYKQNGEGGLFTVHNHLEDMRDVEIWYQMCWHLNEIMGL